MCLKEWASQLSFCYIPWFAFWHSLFPILLLLAIFHEHLVIRNPAGFNFTRTLTIEILPVMCFKANLNNSSSIPSCELLRHLIQIMASAGKNGNLLNANQLLPKHLLHPCNIFKCKFEDQIGKSSFYHLLPTKDYDFLHYFQNRCKINFPEILFLRGMYKFWCKISK